MPDVAVAFDTISKKFRRGELHDSLRDLIPAVARRLTGRSHPEELGKEEFWALRNVSFEVARGEAFGIIGRNGAGKSTALKLLSGVMAPTQGRMTINGHLSALIEIGAGFHRDLTGRENIYLNGTILGMKRQEIARKFDEIVAFSGLEDFIDTPVKRYSSGMFARLGFSVAAHLEPDILVIDEVLSVGDYDFQRKGVEKMRAVAASGATVVFVSHNLRSVADLCHRSLLLEKGEVAVMGPTSQVIDTYLGLGAKRSEDEVNSGLRISRVSLRNEKGPEVQFTSGERAWVDVDVVAHEATDALGISVGVLDSNHNRIFFSGTKQLGCEPIQVRPGHKVRATFEVELNLAGGTYHFGAFLYDMKVAGQIHDRWPAAATFFIAAEQAESGVVHLSPSVVVEPLSERQQSYATPETAS